MSFYWNMKFVYNLLFCSLITSTFVKAQIPITSLLKSNYYLVSDKTIKGQIQPSFFEERISSEIVIEHRDSMVVERFIRFKEKGKTESQFSRKHQMHSTEIKHWKDNVSWIDLNRNKETQTGLLCGKKGTIIKVKLPQRNPQIPATEIYKLENDSTWFIVFKPELNAIELECSGNSQRRYMLGHVFEKMGNITPNTSLGNRLNKQFSIGDRLQILYTTELIDATGKYFIHQPDQVLEYTLLQKGYDSGNEQVVFSTWIHHLQSGTREYFGESTILIFDDGITIGNDRMIGDTLYSNQLKIMSPSNNEILHPFYPLLNLFDPLMIGYWNETDTLKNNAITCNCFWTNNYPGRVCWLPEFPIMWIDNGESSIGKIVYMKKDSTLLGEEYKIPKITSLHIDEISLYKNELSLKIFSEKSTTIKFTIFNQSGVEIKLDKSTIDLKSGLTQFSYLLPNIQVNETIQIKLNSNDKKQELIQEFRIMSRENN
jgi:hypothetical protein